MRKLYLGLIIGILLIGIVFAGGVITSISIDNNVKNYLDKTYSSYKLINQTCEDIACSGLLALDDGKGNINYYKIEFRANDITRRNQIISARLEQIANAGQMPIPIETIKPDEDITLTAKIK